MAVMLGNCDAMIMGTMRGYDERDDKNMQQAEKRRQRRAARSGCNGSRAEKIGRARRWMDVQIERREKMKAKANGKSKV